MRLITPRVKNLIKLEEKKTEATVQESLETKKKKKKWAIYGQNSRARSAGKI